MNLVLQRQGARIKRICDSVQQLPMFRADEKEGVFARQLVMATIQELFRHEFPETKWASGLLYPIFSGVHEGATEYSYIEIEQSGRAKIVADNATDLPRAEIGGRNNILPVKTLGCSVEFTTQEVRTAMMQGMFDMPTEKALAAREAHDRGLNDLIRAGLPLAGLYGATNVPGIYVHSVTTGNWATATAAQIVSDFIGAVNAILINSQGVEVPNSVVLPIESYTRMSTLQNSAASDITVLDYLKKVFPFLTQWEWDAGMSTAGTGGTPAGMVYAKDQRKGRVVMPMTLKPLPPEQRGLVFVLNFESRFGGVMSPRPRSASRFEGI